jgi:hypothetical protein
MTTKEMPSGVWEQETEIAKTDLGQFEELCKKLYALWSDIESREAAVKNLKEDAGKLEDQVMATLKKYNKEKYHVTGCGTISITKRYSWKIPQDLAAKEKFFAYLQSKGIFMQLVGVNSATLNKFCKDELEVAKAEGRVDWNPDGLEAPTLSEKLRMASK